MPLLYSCKRSPPSSLLSSFQELNPSCALQGDHEGSSLFIYTSLARAVRSTGRKRASPQKLWSPWAGAARLHLPSSILLHGAVSWGSHPPHLCLSPASEPDNWLAAVISSQEKAAWGGGKELCTKQSITTLLTAPRNCAHPKHKPSLLSPRHYRSILHPFTSSPPAQGIPIGGERQVQGHPQAMDQGTQ